MLCPLPTKEGIGNALRLEAVAPLSVASAFQHGISNRGQPALSHKLSGGHARKSLRTEKPRAENQEPLSRQDTADDPTKSSPNLQTSQEWNRRLKELLDSNSAV